MYVIYQQIYTTGDGWLRPVPLFLESMNGPLPLPFHQP